MPVNGEHSLGRRKIQRWVYSEKVSSWGQQVLLNQSYTVPTLLWCFLGWARLCCAVPSQVSGGGGGGGGDVLLRRVQTC